VGIFQLHDAGIGGQEKANTGRQNSGGDLQVHAGVLNRLAVIDQRQFYLPPKSEGCHKRGCGQPRRTGRKKQQRQTLHRILNQKACGFQLFHQPSPSNG